MKAIMMSIRPRHVRDILNGDKIKEIRNRFPSDYVGWIYIYVTKGGGRLLELLDYDMRFEMEENLDQEGLECSCNMLNGKVVARFYCDGVDEYIYGARVYPDDEGNLSINMYDNFENNCLLPEACIGYEELKEYCGPDLIFKAIKIGKLEIFEEYHNVSDYSSWGYEWFVPVQRPPQSWIYIDA